MYFSNGDENKKRVWVSVSKYICLNLCLLRSLFNTWIMHFLTANLHLSFFYVSQPLF